MCSEVAGFTLRLAAGGCDRICGKQPADAAERGECAARLLGGDNVDACTETGVESRLKKRPLPARRPVVKERERLVDAVNLFDGFTGFQ